MNNAKYLGIDLGTSNSAVAVFSNGEVKSILNTHGRVNTPSIVRTKKSKVIVGEKAQRYLHSDPSNSFKEFKRVIGTQSTFSTDENGREWRAEELSAEVLKYLKSVAEKQENCLFDKVVITVPALFELPQSNATAEAGRLAGFEQIELIPEPVASGLAAGWDSPSSSDAWLVYDLGGGTFDASLLESRDGLLRVVAHDGDNFLGGRDIDRNIVDWLIQILEEQHQLEFDNKHEDFKAVKRHLESESEKAKIVLSSTVQALIELQFEYDDEDYEFDIELSQAKLAELCEPIIDRTIDICIRLVKSQGLPMERLKRVVLVGGPAHMPMIRQVVETKLAPLAESVKDPMSLVSQGAAIYSATINLACEEITQSKVEPKKHQVWLQYPSVCSELNPTIMGKVVDQSLTVEELSIVNLSNDWKSEKISIDENGVFVVEVLVKPNSSNRFEVLAVDNKTELKLEHQKLTIVHGLTMSDPPLSRSIGLALADGTVKCFLERGTPLPAKRTFQQNIVETIVPGTNISVEIPIVQGERRQSRFCRRVGDLVIDSNSLIHSLQVGSPIEITIEVDRGGNLTAIAKITDQNILIEGVANLIMSTQSTDVLLGQAQNLFNRASAILQSAFRERNESLISQITPTSNELQKMTSELATIEDDVDACQRISRNLIEIESEIEFIEMKDQLSELKQECEDRYFATASIVNEYGSDADKRILNNCSEQMAKLIDNNRQGEVERLIERLQQLYNAAHSNSPSYWKDIFLSWAPMIDVAKNPKKAKALVDQGYALIEKDNLRGLQRITSEFYDLIPNQYKNTTGLGSHDSGIY